MLNSNDNNWKCHCLFEFFFYITDSIFVAWGTIWKEILQSIIWYNYHSNINLSRLKTISQVDNIPNKQIASCGNLDLYPNSRKNSLIVPSALNPINTSCRLLIPFTFLYKSFIQSFPNYCGSVGLLFFNESYFRF